jgi:hypothetical protein
MKKLLTAAALTATGALLVGGAAVASADTTTVVYPSTSGWSGQQTSGGTRSFVFGPLGAPLGAGSLRLSTPVAGGSNPNAAKVTYTTNAFSGTRLADIDGISYSTYRSVAGAQAQLASLNLVIVPSGSSSPLASAYTFTFEPYLAYGDATLKTGEWQTWDAINGGNGRWWTNSSLPSGTTGAMSCPQTYTTCTWNQLKAAYPNATIRAFGVNQGTYNAGTVTSVDALSISISGNRTTFDFEPTADTTKPSCGAMVVFRGRGPGGADEAEVTITDTGSGIASVTNFTVTNGTAHIPAFTPGATSVTVMARKTTQGQPTRFEFDVTDLAGNTTHCV